MILKNLILNEFRNFDNLSLNFQTGMNLISGENGSGKTSIIEAIHILTVGKSFRTEQDKELIRTESEIKPFSTNLQGTFTGKRPEKIIIGYNRILLNSKDGYKQTNERLQKKIKHNNVQISLSNLIGRITIVLFSVEDMEIVTGAPIERRKFLDILLCQSDRSYLTALRKYKRVLKQRNHLLNLIRESKIGKNTIEEWDSQLIEYGTLIIKKRKDCLNSISLFGKNLLKSLNKDLSNSSLNYQCSIPYSENDLTDNYQKYLTEYQDKDLILGKTTIGPHIDDFTIEIQGKNIRKFASRGQARIIALSLKISQVEYFKNYTKNSSIILLDDILSELDYNSQKEVLNLSSTYPQTIITSTTTDWIKNFGLIDVSLLKI